LEELQVENEMLSLKLAALQSTGGSNTPGDVTPVIAHATPVVAPAAPAPTNAGDAFWGRASMQRLTGSNRRYFWGVC
jgi:hypothetical protein